MIMKKVLLVIFALISLNAFSQLQVKEGSFKYVPGGVIDNKLEYTDGNDLPMALIKISTENINEQERLRLVFTGNRATQIIKKPKTGQMWIYISADAATFIDIKHPDYGTYKYYLPEELCDYCVYEMVLQYINNNVASNTYISVNSEPSGANIYIDDKQYGKTPNIITDLPMGKHEIKLEKEEYNPVTKIFIIEDGQKLRFNEKLLSVYYTGDYIQEQDDENEIVANDAAPTVDDVVNNTIVAAEIVNDNEIDTIQEEENSVIELEPEKRVVNVNGVSFTMVAVEGGTFRMGATFEQSGEAHEDEKPVRKVTLDSYWMGETEVTQELWEAVMGSNPSRFKGEQRPVENISWDDCQKFITKLNWITGEKFRLPTEAEWEYAARGGSRSQGYKYSGSNTIGEVAWYFDNSGSQTHDVKIKLPNELGIYDMSGNVWEWCQDRYDQDYYKDNVTDNPQGPKSGSYRLCRGGGWRQYSAISRVSFRGRNKTDSTFNYIGLRLSLSKD